MKKELKNNITIYLSIITLIIILIGGVSTFIKIPIIETTFNLSNIKGFTIVLICVIVNLYSITTNKKLIFYLSIIGAAIGYIYTFSSLNTYINTLKSNSSLVGEDLTQYVEYGIGFYQYIISIITTIINTIMYSLNLINEKEETAKELLNNEQEIKDNYIIVNYIYGIKDKMELTNKPCILIKKETTNNLNLLISGNEVTKIIIEYNQIINIKIKKVILMNNTSKQIQSDEFANKVLATALIGSIWGPIIGGSKLASTISDLNNYNKINLKDAFDIEIEYSLNNKPTKLLLRSKINPQEFLKNYIEKIVNDN